MRRRDFIQQAGLSFSAVSAAALANSPRPPRPEPFQPDDWASVRAQFALTNSYIHLATFLLASHPKPVADAIERHRRGLDSNPIFHWHDNFSNTDDVVRTAAAEYMGGSPNQIALTDSTTMGLGLIYNSLQLEPGQEIITTTHDHYSTHMSLQHRAERTGATYRQIEMYADSAKTSVDEILTKMKAAITDRTRVLAVTWVHSCTGVKLPLRAMAAALRSINLSRDPDDRVLLCVDGVHGFGIEDVTMDHLQCDFFMAGTHKWLFGPRGTGVVWAKPNAWKVARPIIPSFGSNYGVWLGFLSRDQVPVGNLMTPGGFHSFEHRWALEEAFKFHLAIGKSRVQQRIHELNTMAKEAMAEMPHVELYTPMSPELSSGIICFDVEGYTPDEVVEFFQERKIIASDSPYRPSCARLAPSVINNEEEIEKAMAALQEMA